VTGLRRRLDRSERTTKNGSDVSCPAQTMATSISQAEVFIALVVAAHAAVLAVRLSVSLYKA